MMKKVEWYLEFVNKNYKPSKTDLVCLFYFEPAHGITKYEAAGRIASESSTGTWTTLHKLPPRMKGLQATAFDFKGNFVKVAYPIGLWEPGNMPQLLSGIAGNIFGMKALKNLRLVDVTLPKVYVNSFKGPRFGIHGLRKKMKVKKRPITGAVPKPKIGFSAKEHADVAFETWLGGFDLCKDDENLTSTSFNNFYKRVEFMTKRRDKAEAETGQPKDALINITAETSEMIKRAILLHDMGWRYAMIDVVTCGNAAVQTLRDVCGDLGLGIHAHRAMHASFDRNPKHGMAMQFLAKTMRLIGVDQIHSGTGVGKLVGSQDEVQSIADTLRSEKIRKHKLLMPQNWGKIKPAFPVSSGGLHPGLVPDVMKIYGGIDITLLVSGGIHGHPKGTRAGAKATMQAIEATLDGYTLKEAAKNNIELRQALEKWGYLRPR
jgi:ribulose-bisphosphate carboxylase large chain